MATGRQGNLIVSSSHTAKDSEMRQKLIDEIKKQGKPYGLYFEDIEGGFTLTTRSLPQSFQILPVLVWKVYPDGRPDELVRGVDIVGTPLAALNRIEITGEKTEVFNGVCGAESGSVPVSAAAPAMLFSEMEVQKRAHSRVRPPILPPPVWDKTGVGRQTSDLGRLGLWFQHRRAAMICSATGWRSWPLLVLATASVLAAQNSASGDDPVLRAMLAEMQRSKSQLKLADVQAPYYVDYRLMDVDQYVAEAAFGAVRTVVADPHPHAAHRGASGRLQAGQLLRSGRGRGRCGTARRRRNRAAAPALAGHRPGVQGGLRGADRQAGGTQEILRGPAGG